MPPHRKLPDRKFRREQRTRESRVRYSGNILKGSAPHGTELNRMCPLGHTGGQKKPAESQLTELA
jgi:hypothetical protein